MYYDIREKILDFQQEILLLLEEQRKLIKQLELLVAEMDKLRTKYILEKTKKASEYDWAGKTYPWSEKVCEILQNTFKLKGFRLQQLAAINATLSKKDVLLLMPTAGGKSLCYQLPTLVEKGMTLVISPLISLIEDQMKALKKLDISAETMNSSTPKCTKQKIFQYMGKGKGRAIKLMYVTPEWLANSKIFRTNLEKCHNLGNLNRIAVDEVHCCSQWGHDFRPHYKYLSYLKEKFPKVPILGLTGTATTSILLDVQQMLNIEECVVLKSSFNRPNLYYQVLDKPTSLIECLDYIENILTTEFKDQSGVIYAMTVKDTEDLSRELRRRGLRVHYYHSRLRAGERSRIYNDWLNNHYQAVIATAAFGVGINKPDVRFIIHHALPKSMESFYQESGRAGRDGGFGCCTILYSLADYFRLGSYLKSRTEVLELKDVLKYCLDNNSCRHRQIARHFEDAFYKNRCTEMCDCCSSSSDYYYYDITSACKDIFTIINHAVAYDVNLTFLKLLDAWFKTGAKDLRVSSIKKPSISRVEAEYIVAYLILKGILKEDKCSFSKIVWIYLRINSNETKVIMPFKGVLRGFPKIEKRSSDADGPPAKRQKL